MFVPAKTVWGLQTRVGELEELLCPFGQHDYTEVSTEAAGFSGGRVKHIMVCKRCRKKHEYFKVLATERGD